MKKILIAVSALLMLVGVSGAAGTDSFALTVVTQTSSTITFSFPQQAGYGYLYSANGAVVSRTNDPTVTQVKFSKNSQNSYEVAAIVKGATGSYTPPPPPPPPPPPTQTTATMGETGVLPVADNGNGNLLVAQRANLSQGGTLQSLSFYVTTASGNLRLGVYADTGSGPGQLLAQTSSFAAVAGWNTQAVTQPVDLSAGTYWLAYLPSSNTLAFVKADDGTSTGRYYSFAYGTMPATFSSGAASTPSHWSFYATLTTSGSPPPAAACGDGADNDGDGKIDYPADPGCTSLADTDETDPPPPGGGTLTSAQCNSRAAVGGSVIDGATVAGGCNITAANVTIQNSTVNGSITVRASGFKLLNSHVEQFTLASRGDNALLEGNVFDGQNEYEQNFIWADDIVGDGPTGWVIRNNTFKNYISPSTTHSEAIYIGGYASNGLIEGNYFYRNGNTGHIFFSWCAPNDCNGTGGTPRDPHDICVRGNTFDKTWQAYYQVVIRQETFAPNGHGIYTDDNIKIDMNPSQVAPGSQGVGGATDSSNYVQFMAGDNFQFQVEC